MIAKGREQARKAMGHAEALARETAALSGAQATKRVRKLHNAIVEVKRHRAGASAGEKRLSQLAFPEQLGAQQASLAEINLTLARLEAVVVDVRWNAARARSGDLIVAAREAIARLRAAADRIDALPAATVGRPRERAFKLFDNEMVATKAAVALAIADEKILQKAAATMPDAPDPDAFLPRPADAETMQRALAAQSAAVADVLQQLRDVNDRVESIKRQARILEARRRLGV